MPTFTTNDGSVAVATWGYQLQGQAGTDLSASALAASPFDLLVTDHSRNGTFAGAFTVAEVDAMQAGPAGRRVLASYMSIGEADDYRDYWNPAWTTDGTASGALTASAPDWLGRTNPDWPESRKVRYWDSDWQNILFNGTGTGWLDKIVLQGFDGAYLDIVDAYYFWAVEATAAERQPGDPVDEADAAVRMIDFIAALTAHARQTNPAFFVIMQNAPYLIDALAAADPVRQATLLNCLGAIAVEDTYLTGARPENNPLNPDQAVIDVLTRDFAGNGVPVLSVDYAYTPAAISSYLGEVRGDGFLPYAAATRDLDRLALPITAAGGGLATSELMGGTIGADTLAALGGADVLYGLAGADMLDGGAGDDILFGGLGADQLIGGTGTDTASYQAATAGVIVNLATGGSGGEATGDTYTSIERVFGSGSVDQITGGTGADHLYGLGGADVIVGGSGNDFLYGGAGADQLDGSAGIDTANYANVSARVVLNLASGGTIGEATGDTYVSIERVYGSAFADIIVGGAAIDTLVAGAGADSIDGADGNDVLIGGLGADQHFGGVGFDTASYTYATTGVTVSIAAGGTGGEATGDAFTSIERLYGSRYVDILEGGTADDHLVGFAGNDVLNGGAGRDFLFGGADADALNGGDGRDVASYFYATGGGVTIDLADGTGLGGEAAGDTLTAIEDVYGTQAVDRLTGSLEANTLVGSGGADRLDGGAGGNDILSGGTGNDVFVFRVTGASSRITDWEIGVDRIDLTGFAGAGVHGIGDLAITASSGHAMVTAAGTTITVLNAAGLLGETDFDFA